MATKSLHICFLQLPQHTSIISLNNNIPFVLGCRKLTVKYEVNFRTLFKWRVKVFFSSGVNQPGRIADDSSLSGSELKNEWSFFFLPAFLVFPRYALATSLALLCLTIYVMFKASIFFHFLPPRIKPTLPQIRRVITEKVQTGIVM